MSKGDDGLEPTQPVEAVSEPVEAASPPVDRRPLIFGAGVLVVAVAMLLVGLALSGDDDDDDGLTVAVEEVDTTTTTAEEEEETTTTRGPADHDCPDGSTACGRGHLHDDTAVSEQRGTSLWGISLGSAARRQSGDAGHGHRHAAEPAPWRAGHVHALDTGRCGPGPGARRVRRRHHPDRPGRAVCRAPGRGVRTVDATGSQPRPVHPDPAARVQPGRHLPVAHQSRVVVVGNLHATRRRKRLSRGIPTPTS